MATHSYWRLNTTAPASIGYTALGALEMRGSVGGADLCSGGTATASSTYGGQSPALAFDGNNSTYWESASHGAGGSAWIQYQFASPVDVLEIAVLPSASYPNEYPFTISLQWSDDGSSWTTAIPTSACSTPTVGYKEAFTVGSLTKSYWQILISRAANNTDNFYAALSEIQFRSSAGGSDLTSPSLRGCVYGNSVFSTNYAYLAFDDSDTTFWESDIRFNEPVPIRWHFTGDVDIVEYALTSDAAYFSTEAPRDWKLQYSGDGITWVDAHTVSAETGWSSKETRIYTIGGGAPARRRPVVTLLGAL